MIQAVLFDLGNTLVRYYRREEFPSILNKCIHRAAEALHHNTADLDSIFEKALELKEANDFAVRPLEDRIRTIFPECLVIDPVVMSNVCRAFMIPIFSCARLEDDAIEVLDELRVRGLRTAVVSNTPWGSSSELWLEELHRHALLERLDAITFCVDVGWRKPHAAPFLHTLNKLAMGPSDAVFIGDDPRWDVEGAVRVGMRPILLSDNPDDAPNCTRITRLSCLLDPDVLSINND
jgi:FMN phosphatase YigB (HAD superfamily)